MSATEKLPRDRIDPRSIPESIPQEAILQESEPGLAAIINTIPTTAWTTRPDGYCDFLNQCWLDYTGMTAEKAQGWGWAEAIHPDDRRRLVEEWQSCLASGIPVDTEARMRRFDNSYRWFLIRANPLSDESGNILKWYGTCTDIEDRKRGEEDLRARELSWRQIVDNIPGLVATMGALGEVEFLNRQTLEYFGKTNEDLKDWSLIGAVHPDDLPHVIEARKKSIESGQIYEVEHRCRRADGVYRWFQVRGLPVRDTEHRITAWYLLLTDIDDRKCAEQKLQQSEADFRTITNNIPGFVHALSATGEVEFVNQQILEYFGKTSEELKDWARAGVVHPDDLPHVLESFRRSIETGEIYDVEQRCLRSDGVYRWFQSRGRPVRNAEGEITGWYFLLTDIDDRKRAEQALERTQFYLGEGQRLAQMGSWAFGADGFDYWSPELFQVHGLDPSGKPPTVEEYLDLVHPEDREYMRHGIQNMSVGHRAFDFTKRIVRPDGEIRHVRCVGVPLAGDDTFEGFVGTGIDITEQEQLLQKLRQSEQDLRTMTDAIRHSIVVLAPDGRVLHANRVALDLTGLTLDQVKDTDFSRVYHPDEIAYIREERRTRLLAGIPFDLEMRLLFNSGEYRWQLIKYNPLKDEAGKIIRWYATATDIDDRKRAEENLRQSERELRTITDTICQVVVVLAPDGATLYANQVILDLTGLSLDDAIKHGAFPLTFHPEDVDRFRAEREGRFLRGDPFELEMRLRLKNGQYRWYLCQYNPLKDESGKIIRWYASATDIDDRKRAEERLRQSEEDLRTITDTIRQPIVVLAPDGALLYANRVALDNSGLTMSEVKDMGYIARAWHPDDVDRALDERNAGLSKGRPFDSEMRLLFKNGGYRWQLVQYDPLKDERGQIIRWYATVTDIDDRKKTEERLHNENLELREEIDRSSMFEEIVGSSKPMSQLLKKVEKVAPSDSTVLILGETGTGKELIARALHRRSKRASRAFVKVNCAAIPQSLIASELFGHEKGAFTGALQRRLGRFEAANGGTLFLDEIGELPMETQIALLRVLQEKELERVGSNHPISVDVRVIAATNRDLSAAVAAGTFRQDLFYRLDVFPISVPPLRERAEDIPLLVEYFVGRFAKDAGKNIRHIGKQTLERLQSCRWPGNIRELQNVVERAVILCETDAFVVDESWLESEPEESTQREGLSALEEREVEMIEAVLAETHGRISGPSGAAAKLGIPRQTLESKIRRLGIDKYGQKRPTAE